MSPLEQSLRGIAGQHSPAVLAHSLQAEDMVLTDIIARARLPIEIFVLDTGRLHGDSLALIDRIRRHYALEVQVYAPDQDAVADYVRRHGRDAFYGGVELRKRCCEIRKVEPLRRAKQGLDSWISGRKAFQSVTRQNLPRFEIEDGRLKVNPLGDWTKADLDAYFEAHDLPRHPLEAKGYLSVGCEPCTSTVAPGEDPRAGRWRGWDKTECGIHAPGTALDEGELPPGYEPAF